MTRKIVQLIAAPYQWSTPGTSADRPRSGGDCKFFALCDDGSLWELASGLENPYARRWVPAPFPAVPQGEFVPARYHEGAVRMPRQELELGDLD